MPAIVRTSQERTTVRLWARTQRVIVDMAGQVGAAGAAENAPR